MVSLGIELSRAFCTALARAAFASGSGPPSFAATMMARDSLEKSCPRLASAAPFLRLMVAHLLCPDTRSSLPRVACIASRPHPVDEEGVEPQVVGELGVERGDEHLTLARCHPVAVVGGEHLDAGPG